MPQRPREHIIEDLARMQLHQTFAKVGWASENLDKDYGEDILVRIFEAGKATPWSFFVQSKGTDNLERYMSKDQKNIFFPIKSKHIEHWSRFWEPVVLAIYDARTETTYWEVIQTYLEAVKDSKHKKTRKSISVHVPTDNLLDVEGLQRIRNRTKNRFQRFEAQKEGAEILIDELSEKWGVDIEYDPEFGILMLPKGEFHPEPTGGHTVIAFGKFASQLERIQEKHGIDPESAFGNSIELMLQVVKAFKNGARLQIQDKEGVVVEQWKNIEDLLRHVDRQMEIDDD